FANSFSEGNEASLELDESRRSIGAQLAHDGVNAANRLVLPIHELLVEQVAEGEHQLPPATINSGIDATARTTESTVIPATAALPIGPLACVPRRRLSFIRIKKGRATIGRTAALSAI